jgi:hypothetical protein
MWNKPVWDSNAQSKQKCETSTVGCSKGRGEEMANSGVQCNERFAYKRAAKRRLSSVALVQSSGGSLPNEDVRWPLKTAAKVTLFCRYPIGVLYTEILAVIVFQNTFFEENGGPYLASSRIANSFRLPNCSQYFCQLVSIAKQRRPSSHSHILFQIIPLPY